MLCARCSGLRILEVIAEGGIRVWALRCISCGDVTDRVITQNRTGPRRRAEHRPRTPVYGSRKWDRATSRLVSSNNQ